MEGRLTVINCTISNPESVAVINEKLYLQSNMIIARLGVPCRKYGVSVISTVVHRTQNQISSFTGDLGKVDGVKTKSIQISMTGHQPRTNLQKGKTMEHMEALLSLIVNIAVLIFEFIGVGIVVYSGLTGFFKFLCHSSDTRIYLAKGLAIGPEFKMGGEILRAMVVREWKEIRVMAGIIVLHVALTFLIHWEIKEEEKIEHDSLSP